MLVGVLAGGASLAWCSANGESGGVWPAVVTLLGSAAVYLVFSQPRNRKFFPLVPLGILFSVFAASQLRDSSGDGLGAHVEQVHRHAAGLEFHPSLLSPMSGRPALFSMAVFPAAGFSLESGKWVHFALALAGGLMLGAAVHEITGSRPGSLVAALMAILQPALLYQAATFYQDGILVGAVTIFFASILRFFSAPGWRTAMSLLLALVTVAWAKKTGLVQAAWMALLLPPAFFFLRRSMVPFRSFLGAVLVISPILALTLLSWPMPRENQKVLNGFLQLVRPLVDARGLDPGGSGGIHGGCGEVSPHAPVMYWKRNFTASKRGEDGRGIKPPFWFTRPELDVFSDLTPDLRFGGYGPLYPTAFFLSMTPGLWLLVAGSRRQAGWMWILAACLFLIPLTPSWWARWFPQGWWIPLAACVGFLCGAPDWRAKFKWVGWLARLGLLALGLNSLLIFVFTAKGYFEAEAIIRRQLAFLKTLPAPLEIETGHFTATRFWLDQEKIPYRQKEIPADAVSLVMYRTTLKIQLSEGDLERLQRDPDHFRSLQKHKLLNLPRPSQPSA